MKFEYRTIFFVAFWFHPVCQAATNIRNKRIDGNPARIRMLLADAPITRYHEQRTTLGGKP